MAWGVILAALIGISAAYGGRNCEVPKSGLFHRLMAGETFVPTHRLRYACAQVSSRELASPWLRR